MDFGQMFSKEAWEGKTLESGQLVSAASLEYGIEPAPAASSRHDHVPPIPIGHQRM